MADAPNQPDPKGKSHRKDAAPLRAADSVDPEAEAQEALRAAEQAVRDLQQAAAHESADEAAPLGLDLLSQVNLNVRIELGRTRMLIEDVLRLNEGSVVELDKLAGDPVDVYVNDRLVALGEVLVVNDAFCVRINEIVSKPVESVGRSSLRATA